MKKLLCIVFIVSLTLLASCTERSNVAIIGGADGPTSITVAKKGEKIMYEEISQEKAKEIMDGDGEYIVLDVREKDEFDEGHISGAVLLPYTQIDDRAEEMLPDKEKLILVYCRSGRRSKIAASSLIALGYTNVKEFGGIIDWQYGIVK